jgi:hypothetical protein
MPSPLVIPFDNNPVSTTFKTAAYTIPAGKFARVTPMSALFSLNGSQVFPSRSITCSGNVAASTLSTSFMVSSPVRLYNIINNVASYTNGTISCGVYQAHGSSASIGTADTYLLASGPNRTSVGTSSTALSIDVNTGPMFVFLTSNGSLTSSSTVTLQYYFMTSPQSFFVPTGTVLDGSRYMVEEYNSIS